jgi:hypothetical protein
MMAAAALGLALSACGGGGGSASGASGASGAAAVSATAAPGSTVTQGSAPTQGAPPTQGANPPTASAAAVTINWLPPTENTDGTSLANLAGYKIHYGTASKKYTETITVSNPGLARYVISSLSPGTYYFSVTAYNSAGTESPLSSEVSAKVD